MQESDLRRSELSLFSYKAFHRMVIHGCSAQNGKDVTDTVLLLNQYKVQIGSISEKEYKKAVQVGRLHKDTTQVKKSEGELVLSISGNTKVILQDSFSISDKTEQVTYNYIGHFKEVGLYVIKVQYYETGKYMLVNDKT